MGCVQRSADRPALDPERVSDPLIVQVGVVAQKQNQPLPLGKQRNRGAKFGVWIGMPVRRREAVLLLRLTATAAAVGATGTW